MVQIQADMVTKELARLRSRYEYHNRGFVECFQMWTRERGLCTSLLA